jgi:hypothetical protein
LVVLLLLASVPAAGTIASPVRQIAIGDVVVTEPSGRNTTATVELPVTLTLSTPNGIDVRWRTVAGGAGASDFEPASGVVGISGGWNGTRIPVQIRTDKLTESDETFFVELTSVSAGSILDGFGEVTIRDSVPGLGIGDATLYEPDDGALEVSLPVTLSTTAKKAVNFTWAASSGSGTVGSDALAGSGSGTIAQGSLSALVPVAILGDTELEPDETIHIDITSVQNAELSDPLGVVTIGDNDATPPPTPTPLPTATPVATATPTATATSTPTPSSGDAFGWQPPDGAVPPTGTALYLESSEGDYVGQGQRYFYTKANSLLTVSTTGGRVDLSVHGDQSWDGQFAEDRTSVETGYWEGLAEYPSHTPGLTFSGEGRGCGDVLGRFIVDEVTYSAGVLESLTIRFEQSCEAVMPPLMGFLRYDSNDPTVPPPPGDPAGFPWSPPAHSVPAHGNYFYFESTPGDFIADGRTELHTDSFTVTESSGVVRLEGVWNGIWSGPDAQAQLQVGLYDNLQRYAARNPVEGGLEFWGEGRGCNTLAGAFAVDEIAYDASGLTSITLRFVQRCEVTGPPLYGSLRWERPRR